MTNATGSRSPLNGARIPREFPYPLPRIDGAHRNAEHETVYVSDRGGWGLAGKVTLGGVLLTVASLFLVGLAATQGYVSWFQQFNFVDAAKHATLPSRLEATGLDAGAVVFAILAVALAKLGRRAGIERLLNVACGIGSGIMNVLGADLSSPRSVAVYVLPPLLYVAGSDRLISVLRRQALGKLEDEAAQRSLWATVGRAAGRTVLYTLRLTVAPSSTVKGARAAILAAAPVPAAPVLAEVIPAKAVTSRPARKAITGPRPQSKTSRFLALVVAERGPLDAIDPAQVSRICEDLAPRVELDKGSARTALRRAVLAAGGAQ